MITLASVEKRGKSWRLIAFLGYDSTGSQIKRTKTIPIEDFTKHEAQKLANKFEAEELKNKQTFDRNMTFKQFSEYWETNTPDYSITTKDRNKKLLSRILPAIGHIRLRKLTAQHIMALLRQLEEPGKRQDKKTGSLSSRTIQMHYKLVSSMLGKAVKWKFLHENICSDVDTPKAVSKKIPIYGDEETLLRFLYVLLTKATLKYQAFFLLALTSGLRRSEILGLRWTDINFEKSFLRVNQAAVRATGKQVVYKEPKTDASEAPVAITSITLGILKLLRAEQATIKRRSTEKKTWKEQENDIIFTTATGTPMMPSTFGHWLKSFTERHGLPPIGVHAFRHMAASYALDSGFDIKHVSEFVRHAQISTTGDIYAHPLSSKMKQLSAALDDIVKKAMTETPKSPNSDPEKNKK